MIRRGAGVGRRARASLVVWGTAIAITGTLGGCGRYGPPQRIPSKAPATGTGVGVPVGEPVGADEARPDGAEPAGGVDAVDEPSDDEKNEKR